MMTGYVKVASSCFLVQSCCRMSGPQSDSHPSCGSDNAAGAALSQPLTDPVYSLSFGSNMSSTDQEQPGNVHAHVGHERLRNNDIYLTECSVLTCNYSLSSEVGYRE